MSHLKIQIKTQVNSCNSFNKKTIRNKIKKTHACLKHNVNKTTFLDVAFENYNYKKDYSCHILINILFFQRQNNNKLINVAINTCIFKTKMQIK